MWDVQGFSRSAEERIATKTMKGRGLAIFADKQPRMQLEERSSSTQPMEAGSNFRYGVQNAGMQQMTLSESKAGELLKEAKDSEVEILATDSYVCVGQTHEALISGIAYCLCSCSMVLLNKVVLSGYNLEAGISFMFYQNLVSVLAVYTLRACGAITTEPFSWKLVGIWFPVNVIFVGMLLSSIYSLKYMNVAMVTILKNTTNIITAVGEVYLFNKQHNIQVWISLSFMFGRVFKQNPCISCWHPSFQSTNQCHKPTEYFLWTFCRSYVC